MEAYTIYKNITLAICAIGLIYYLICYLRAEDRIKAHYHQYRWRRWEEEHHQLEFNLKIKAYEMLVFILLSTQAFGAPLPKIYPPLQSKNIPMSVKLVSTLPS